MNLSLRNIRWSWVLVGTVVALAIAYGSSVCVVTGYAALLSVQAQAAPDMALINDFAARNAPGISSVFILLGTLLGGLLAGRKAKTDQLQNGLLVGLITAVVVLILDIAGGASLWTAVSVILAVAGGWLGGRLAGTS